MKIGSLIVFLLACGLAIAGLVTDDESVLIYSIVIELMAIYLKIDE